MRENLAARCGGLRPSEWPDCDVPCYLGVVELPANLSVPPNRDSRNNRLIEHALAQDNFVAHVEDAIGQYGAARLGVVMGTSTSSIDRTEAAYGETYGRLQQLKKQYDPNNLFRVNQNIKPA